MIGFESKLYLFYVEHALSLGNILLIHCQLSFHDVHKMFVIELEKTTELPLQSIHGGRMNQNVMDITQMYICEMQTVPKSVGIKNQVLTKHFDLFAKNIISLRD